MSMWHHYQDIELSGMKGANIYRIKITHTVNCMPIFEDSSDVWHLTVLADHWHLNGSTMCATCGFWLAMGYFWRSSINFLIIIIVDLIKLSGTTLVQEITAQVFDILEWKHSLRKRDDVLCVALLLMSFSCIACPCGFGNTVRALCWLALSGPLYGLCSLL